MDSGRGTALVTGASGAAGPSVVAALLNGGFRVRVLVRESSDLSALPSSLDLAHGDLRDTESLRRAAAGADTVVHLAGQVLDRGAPAEAYREINERGTANLIAASRGARRFVYYSSVSVYGPGKQIRSESSVPRPDTDYAKSKLAAERLVLDREGGTVLRLASIYGPPAKGNYGRLVRALAARRFAGVGRGDNVRALIHDADAAQATLLTAVHEAAPGRIFNLADGGMHRMRDIVAAICAALGRRPPRVSVPLPLARAAAFAGDAGLRLIGKPDVFCDAIDKCVETIAVDAGAIQRELGFRPVVDLRSGWADAVRRMTIE